MSQTGPRLVSQTVTVVGQAITLPANAPDDIVLLDEGFPLLLTRDFTRVGQTVTLLYVPANSSMVVQWADSGERIN